MERTIKRFIGDGINTDIKNSSRNNVLNIVRALVESKDCKVYIPSDYKNDTIRTSSDPKVHFYPTDCGRRVEVVGIQSNQERYNFSLICLVEVFVESSTEDGSVEMLDKKVWRQFHIIRDGKLCMDHLCVALTEDVFNDLKKLGILYYNGVRVEPNHNFKENYIYKIKFDGLPLISYNWANPVSLGLYDYMIEEARLANLLKVMKAYKKDNEILLPKENSPLNPDESNIYTEAYGGYEKSEDREKKQVECIVYSIEELKNMKFDVDESEFKNLTLNALNAMISNVNKELRYVRFLIRCIVYAIESTEKKGSYNWSEPVKSPRSEKYSRSTKIDVDGTTFTLVRTNYIKNI